MNGPNEARYAPPSGPPPGYREKEDEDYLPPPGPPPSSSQPPYAGHDWQTAVPDTSLLPPPPALFSGHDRSPTNNATEDEAEAGELWCAQHALAAAVTLSQSGRAALLSNNIRLLEPAGFSGRLTWLRPGCWAVRSPAGAPDRCIVGSPPLYTVNEGSPGTARTIYYEVKVGNTGSSHAVNLALGFTALPYPPFRLPGWHRGSLAVHGDDGHRYINDRWGGKAFTDAFRAGETYGIGMVIRRGARVDIFFTRNGARTGGWNLHEETDAEQDLPVTGLEGFHDVTCAIGVFEQGDFEVVFEPSRWLYVPS